MICFRIYSLAELAQLQLKKLYQNRQWTQIRADEFSLPSGWYKAIDTVVTEKFLPANFDVVFKRPASPAPSPKKTPKPRSRVKSTPSSSTASAGSTGRSRRSLPRRAKNVPVTIDFDSDDEVQRIKDEQMQLEEQDFEDPLSVGTKDHSQPSQDEVRWFFLVPHLAVQHLISLAGCNENGW